MKRAIAFIVAMFIAGSSNAATVMPIWKNDTAANTISFQDTFGHQVAIGAYNPANGSWSVPSNSIFGTSGGILYFPSGTAWASSGVLTANKIMLGGGAGAAPTTPVGLGTTTQVLHGNAAGAPAFGAIVSADVSAVLASPPVIGGTAPNTIGATALSASGLVSGAGFSAYLASPPTIGGTAPNSGAFTTLSATGTSTLADISASGSISGAGFIALFASPSPVGSSAPSTGAFTSLAASGVVSGAGFTTLFASPPSIGNTAPTSGAFTTLSATGTTTVSADISTTAHYLNTSSVPVISACGTSPPAATAGSSNSGGQFTTGTATPTTCTVTFAVPYPTTAWCTVSPATANAAVAGVWISAQSKTAFTVTQPALSSTKYNYSCNGN